LKPKKYQNQSKPKYMKQICPFLGVLVAFLFTGSTYAQPVPIGISGLRYSTFVSATTPSNGVFTTASRTTLSSSSFSDELIVQGDNNYGGESRANSSLAEVEAYSGVFGGNGLASASSQIYFSPLVNRTETVGLQFSSAVGYYCCSGLVSLFDLTSQLELWNYSWSNRSGNVPWVSTPGGAGSASAELYPRSDFLASHHYQLTLMTSARSASDHDQCRIRLTGLQQVPEPAGVCLLLMGLLGLPLLRRVAIR
jgi:hypothetical protein